MFRTTPFGDLRDPGAMTALVALAVGALWIIGTLAAAFALLGAERVFALRFVEWLALCEIPLRIDHLFLAS